MDGITAATAVGWVVSPIIKSVIEKTHNYIANKYFKEAGIEDGMKKLEVSLTEILSVMGTVEKQRIVDPNQAQLVRKIKDAVYDAEDVMDEFEYNLLDKKSQKQRNMVSHVASSSSHSIYQFFVGNDKFKKKVKEVNESLDRARVSAQTLLNLMNVISSQNMHTDEFENWCVTSSLIYDEFVGREKERAALIDLLLTQNDVAELFPIIPIVGQPGIGKTTLAQMVYNDQKLHDHFEQKLWLTVSDNFDKVRLTKEMLKYVSPNFSTEDVNFDNLQTKLLQELASKRVLLVFDDVWYNGDDTEQYGYEREWRQVLAPLRKAEQGSKIILTTRFPIVGRILGPVTPVSLFPLDGLCEEDSWSLFKLCAFNYGNEHNLQELESTGKEIVNKLKGSALAIRVVGGQLRGNSDTEAWKRILDNNPLDTGNIMNILYRSYEHLPGHLQRCFAFCSLFPKDYLLKPRWLVAMWIAEGFVLPRERKSPEEIGRDYFNGLVSRSFIQMIKRGKKEYYVMHDLMNDLACCISKDECYVLNRGDRLKNLGPIRHLSVTPGAFRFQRIAHMCGLDKLRTLIFLDKHSDDADLTEVLIKLKRIRVLHIGWAGIKSLQKIGECKHLRYLRFGSYDKKIAPECFSKLHYLAALLIKNKSHNLQTDKEYFSLSQILCKLSTLVLMDTSKSFIVDVGGLTPDLFNVWRGGSVYLQVEKEKGHGLDQLNDINNIKGSLRICCLENVTSREEAVKAQLHRKLVKELSLEWSGFSGEVDKKYHEVLEALKPNSSIVSLYIYGYPATVCPSWLESNWLSGIESIKLRNCSGIEILPALGQLPLLRKLWFESMIAVRRIGHEFYGNGTFPSLKELVFNELWSFAEWFRPCDDELFPKLQTLRIMNCPNFTESNWEGFPALESLEICSSDAMIMKEPINGYGCLLTIIKLEIINCAEIVTWESCYELVSVKILRIKNCPNLLSIPEMEYLYSLGYLSISDCPKLKSLPKKGLPVSLQLLFIDGTHLLEEQIRCKKGTEWKKVAAISGCVCFISKGKGWKCVKEIDRNFATILCSNNGGPASSMHQMKRKVIVKVDVDMCCAKDKIKVLKLVGSLEGIMSVSIMDSDKLITEGSVDPADVIVCLGRKGIYAELVDAREHQPQRR